MSKFAIKAGRRIMALALSLAMVMSGMPVYASELSADGASSAQETVIEAAADSTAAEAAADSAGEKDAAVTEAVVDEADAASADAKADADADETAVSDKKNDAGTGKAADSEDKEETEKSVENKEGTFVTTKFYEKYTNGSHNQSDPVDDITGLSVTNIKYNDNKHGLSVSNGTMTLSLGTDKRYDIFIWGCGGAGAKDATTMTASSNSTSLTVGVDKSAQGTDDENGNEKAPKFTVLDVQGDVVLTFGGGQSYLHSIIVEEHSTARHIVTVESVGQGSVSVSSACVNKDGEVTLTAVPTPGNKLTKWEVTSPTGNDLGIASKTDTTVKFNMPDSDVTIKATFEKDAAATYNLTALNGYHGTAKLKDGQGTGIAENAEVTLADVIEATADEGYTFKEWYVTTTPTTGANANKAAEVTVANGKFTMPAGNVEIIPIFTGIAKGTYSFQNAAGKDRAKGSQLKDFSGIITFDSNLKDDNNSHGFQTSAADATMKLTLSGAAKVEVVTCCYGNSTVTAAIGDSAYTPVTADTSEKDGDKIGKKHTITTDKGGELLLTFANSGAYIHSVDVTYPVAEVDIESDLTRDFSKEAVDNKYAQNAEIENGGGLSFEKFVWWGNEHGIQTKDGTITLNLKQDKKAVITVTSCAYDNTPALIIASSGKVQPVEKVKNGGDDKEGEASKYTIVGATGKTVLTFGGNSNYLHKLEVKYLAATEHLITVNDADHGTAKASAAYAAEGTAITMTATPADGYKLSGWTTTPADLITADGLTFNMPTSDVTLTPVFVPAGTSRSITVAATAENGTAAATQVTTAYSGTKVSLDTVATATANKGFELYGWKITYKLGEEDKTLDATDDGAGKFSFDMPDADVTITPVFGAAKTVKAGIYNFTQTQKDLLIDGMAFDKFTHAKNVHGCETTEPGAAIKLNLEKRANITVTACTYGVGTKAEMASTSGTVKKTTWSEGEGLTAPVFNVRTKESGEVTLSFSGYTTGGAGTVWLHSISIEYLLDVVPDVYTDGIDVWDFGAEQLESTAAVKYNNKLTEDIINGWYPGIDAGTSGKNIASFEVKDADGNTDFMFSDGGYPTSHRLRTDNEKLTRYDSKTLKIGDTAYHGYIYDNKGKSKDIYVGVKLNAGDRMTAVVSSNGGAYTITVEDPEGEKQTFAKPTGASVITYYATKSGLHKIYNETDEKLAVARVTREHSKEVTVGGNVTVPSGANPADIKLRFTCRESGDVKIANVGADKSYSVKLFEKYSYDVAALPTTYVITEGKEIVLGKANAAQAASHDIKITGVVLRTVSGNVTGMDAADLKKLQISITKPANKLYQPVIELKAETGAYSMKLENGVEYTMVTEGVNDYELDFAQPNNSDKITVVSDTKKNIAYNKKPVYNITIAPAGATAADLAAAEFTFTNLNEEGYVYTFTGTENIKLRDGVYSVKVDKSGAYTQKLTPNLKVDGEDVNFAIGFKNAVTTEWDFSKDDWTEAAAASGSYNGLTLSGVNKNKTYALMGGSGKIVIPANKAGNITVTFCYQAAASINGTAIETASKNTAQHDTVTYNYNGEGEVAITSTGTSYIEKISINYGVYKAELKVGANADGTKADGYDYATINEAVAAASAMARTAEQAVTISIKPGNYEEMLVIDTPNITLKNESAAPSLGLRNKGVDIDANAVRITSYYGHGYSYYSMGNDCKWNEDVLAANKANGYESYTNPGSGTTNGSYWNATVVIKASNVKAEGIIFENSFNQYISKKAADDVIVKQGGAKEGKTARASMAYGDTTVQQKEYVERAAALAITDNLTGVMFDNCKFISRQDTLYGGAGAKAAFYNCSIYGGTDYIFGGMTAVLAKCDLVFNTNDRTDAGIKNDIGYITASQTKSGKGYLMYNCHVTSTKPGVDTESQYTSKPGYLGRPWQSATGQAVFYKTVVDEADAKWRAEGAAEAPISLIVPAGWHNGLSGESVLSEEFGTYEVAKDVDNSVQRAKWATTHKTNPYESDAKALTEFLGDWDAFAGKDMTVSLPSDAEAPAPAAPTAIVSPAETEDGGVKKVVKGAEIVLSADTGAKIYYTLNAADAPAVTGSAVSGTPYTGAVKAEESNIKDGKVTIKAIAVRYGKASGAATFEYTVVDAPKPAAPVFATATGTSVLLGSRAVITAEQGAAVYYNVNAEAAPDTEATLYTGKLGIEITLDKVNKADSTVKIQAVAVKNGVTSDAAAVTYTVKVNAPKPSIKSGYQFPDGGGKIELSADEDVEILYTMGADAAGTPDPKTAETGVNTYDKAAGISINNDVFIKAAAKRGTAYSDVVALSYRVPLSMPTASPADGAVIPFTGGSVALAAPSGAKIYYTIGENPADPTEESTLYSEPIKITETATIKAIAVKGEAEAKTVSKLAVFTYTVKVDAPKANPMPIKGQVKADTKITLTSETGTKIYYTQGAVLADTPDPAKDAQGTTAAEKNTAEITIGDKPVIKAIAIGETNGKAFTSAVAVFEYDKIAEDTAQAAKITAKAAVGDDAVPTDIDGIVRITRYQNVTIKLASATEGADIYYTTDGSEPTKESYKYQDSMGIILNAVEDETLVKAVATKTGMRNSEVITITVKVTGEPPKKIIKLTDCDVAVPDIIRRRPTDPVIPQTYVTYKGYRYIEGIDYVASDAVQADGDVYSVTLKGLERDTDGREQEAYRISSDELTVQFKAVAPPSRNDGSIVDISKARIDIAKASKNQYYTGARKEAELVFKDAALEKLYNDGRINCAYKNNINAGKATVSITVWPDSGDEVIYAGAKELSFNIRKAELNKRQERATARVYYDKDASEAQSYTGGSIRPIGLEVMTLDGNLLAENVDYTVVCKVNNRAEVTLSVKGIGNNIGGSYTDTFQLQPLNLSKVDVKTTTAAYSSRGARLSEISVAQGANVFTLKDGVDYTAKYSYGTSRNKGKPGSSMKVTIKGKGVCNGQQTFDVAIRQADFNSGDIIAPEVIVDADRLAAAGSKTDKIQRVYEAAMKVSDSSGAKLKAGRDYTVTVKDTAIEIAPAGVNAEYYTGTKNVTYRVAGNLAKQRKLVFGRYTAFAYDGRNPVQITQKDIDTINAEQGTAYVLGTNIRIVPGSYRNNARRGTAQVTLEGIGGFYGTKVLKFKIVKD